MFWKREHRPPNPIYAVDLAEVFPSGLQEELKLILHFVMLCGSDIFTKKQVNESKEKRIISQIYSWCLPLCKHDEKPAIG